MTATEFSSRKATACSCTSNANDAASAPAPRGHSLRFLQWLVSAGVLLLMPKCPACLAAYVALATGMGLGFTTAACLRIALLALCTLSLLSLSLRIIAQWRLQPQVRRPH